MKKFIFRRQNEDGTTTEEEVKPERWGWGVIYKDDTALYQFSEDLKNIGSDGKFHQIREIEQDKIKLAVLYKIDEPLTKQILIPWKDGMKLIHKYINVHSALQHENFNDTARIYVFGYKIGKETHYSYILPDDRIIYSNEENIDLTKFKLK